MAASEVMEQPQRKHVRLRDYDYGQNGAYFVTICTQGRRCVLSEIVGRGLAPAVVRLTNCGCLIEKELQLLPLRYPSVKIEKYVIMPNHIHVLFLLDGEAAGASPRPTLVQVIGAFKSLSTRKWNQKTQRAGQKIWQEGFYEHIIRDDNDFLNHWQYIDNNPARWAEDEYFGGSF